MNMRVPKAQTFLSTLGPTASPSNEVFKTAQTSHTTTLP